MSISDLLTCMEFTRVIKIGENFQKNCSFASLIKIKMLALTSARLPHSLKAEL